MSLKSNVYFELLQQIVITAVTYNNATISNFDQFYSAILKITLNRCVRNVNNFEVRFGNDRKFSAYRSNFKRK